VHDQVRSLSPTIGARTAAGAIEFKVWRTWPYGQAGVDPAPLEGAAVSGSPGRLAVVGERLFAGCREGVVEMLVVQPAGKNRMSAAAFLRGYGGRLGDRLEPVCEGGRKAPGGGGRGAGGLRDSAKEALR